MSEHSDGIGLGKALDRAYLWLNGSSFEDYVKAVREIEREYLETNRDYPRYALETQRRVAEGILHAAVVKRRPLGECRRFLRELEDLGYTDIGQEFTMVCVMSRYFREHGASEEADRMAIAFCGKLDELVTMANRFRVQLSDPKNTQANEDNG